MWLIDKLKNFNKKKPEIKEEKKIARGIFSTDFCLHEDIGDRFNYLENLLKKSIQRDASEFKLNKESYATDSAFSNSAKLAYNNTVVPEASFSWFVNQGFIGYQASALIFQHWLVSKACTMPAEDAVRNGYEITSNDGQKIDTKIINRMKEIDDIYKIDKNLIEYVQMGRCFGIRIALFKVESDDPEYYKKPFNIDGIEPGSYKGISQIDPYWITPWLGAEAAGDPSSIDFYVPTFWNLTGLVVHKSHLVIYNTQNLPDILKPTYLYGGVPLPQQIYERIYAAERTANEAPMLALTKRLNVLKTDMSQAAMNQGRFARNMAQFVLNRDNYGIKAIDTEEEMTQTDISLADLDSVIMTQYQLVAAIAQVPATKLLGTSPKGFNTTGEYEEASYHEFLEGLQKNVMTPLLQRHHELVIKSIIMPEFQVGEFRTQVCWEKLDAMTAEEKAAINKAKAETGNALIMSGAIDGQDERKRIINDPDSGYNGLLDQIDEDRSNEFSDLDNDEDQENFNR